MSLEDMYTKHRDRIIARDVTSLIKANGTPDQIISDGESQLVIARQDEPKLTVAGMDSTLITDVEEILQAYSWIAAKCHTMIIEHHEDKEIYKALKEKGYDCRKVLVKYAKFGCKKNKLKDVFIQLNEIIEGSGDGDMIFDLLKLNHLFVANPTITDGLLEFNPAWIAEALELHTQLRALRAEVKNPETDSEIEMLEMEVRQAYDLYHEVVYDLRGWGEFVFDGEERAEKYKAEYRTSRY